MAYRGLNWQKLELPFIGGLSQKTDDRARPAPFLDVCNEAQFDELGGLQTRLPFTVMSNAIFGGGTLANCRRLAVVNDELCVFTDTTLYSWNAQLAKWVSRGTHLAVAVSERPRFATTGDQVDGDRAELAGTLVYAWTEGAQVFAAAMDKVTGSVLVSPTAVSTAIGRPRLVALATKILLFVEASTTLLTVRAIDPATPGTAIGGAGTTVLATDFNLYYDVVRAGTQDLCVGACRRQTTTSYTAFTVTPALAVTTSTKGRTADGPLAVATIADGTQVQVVRGNGTNVQGDLLTASTLADAFTGQAIGTVDGTPINQIAAAFAATTCTVFWSSLETSDSLFSGFQTKSNTVTTANAVGSEALFVRRIGVGSRAFEYGSSVYVWLAFGEDSAAVVAGTPLGIRAQLQNTYFLYRADRLLVSKAVWQRAGGYSPATGHLPGVALVSGSTTYAWAGASRRVIDLGGGSGRSGFGARSPQDVVFSFDADAARRTVQIGRTLYVSGGLVQQYDGVGLVELGAQVYPWSIAAQDSGVAGNLAAGTYNWKGTIRYVNAQNEKERSTTATGVQLAMGTHIAIITYFPLYVTNKTARPPNLEFWRTAVNLGGDAPYYLVTGQNPNVITGNNPWIPNSTTTGATFNDNYSDATLTVQEQNPENEGVLEDLAPPGTSILIATDTRIFAGVAGDPHRIAYSKQRNDGEVAAFHDQLFADVPRPGGDITSIAFLDEVLYVFRETAIYALPGVGFDNFGTGQNFGPVRTVSLDVGAVSHEAVALTPLGLVFKSSKGWYLLHGNGGVEYIGDKVSDFDAETVFAVNVMESQHQIRILTENRMLIWDYRANQWGQWTIETPVDALVWNGQHVLLTATGPTAQATSYAGTSFGLDVERAWIKPADLMGAVQVRRIQPLGEFRSAHLQRMRVAYNYDPTYVDDVVWSPSPTTVGGPLQFSHSPSRPRCEAIKIRLTAVTDQARATLATASMLILTNGAPWAATWRAALVGELGNRLTMSIAFVEFDGASIAELPVELPFDFASETGIVIVNDNYTWDLGLGQWVVDIDNIGVLVAGTITVADLEVAIADTNLATLLVADASPKTVDVAAMLAAASVPVGQFSGGAFGAPTGEALKLTGLGLEVGIAAPGLFNRLPGSQRA